MPRGHVSYGWHPPHCNFRLPDPHRSKDSPRLNPRLGEELFRCGSGWTHSTRPHRGEEGINMIRSNATAALALGLIVFSTAEAQVDPGVRPGPINGQPGATQLNPLPLASVTPNSPAGDFFANGLDRFQEVDEVV